MAHQPRDGSRQLRLAVWLMALILVPLTAIGWAAPRCNAVIKERLPTTLALSNPNTKGRTLQQVSEALGGNLTTDLMTTRPTSLLVEPTSNT